MQSFSLESAAAQYAADKLGDFKRDPRIVVCHHLHIHRKLVFISSNTSQIDKIFAMNKNDGGFKDLLNQYESWGMTVGIFLSFFISSFVFFSLFNYYQIFYLLICRKFISTACNI